MKFIKQIVESHVVSPARFLQIDKKELNKKFKDLPFIIRDNDTSSELNLNQYAYNRILEIFSSKNENNQQKNKIEDNKIKKNENLILEKKQLKLLKKRLEGLVQKKKEEKINPEANFSKVLDFKKNACNELNHKISKNLKNLKYNCEEYSKDYDELKTEYNSIFSSFMQQAEDFVNVKFCKKNNLKISCE